MLLHLKKKILLWGLLKRR